jgi:biotin operon repressor
MEIITKDNKKFVKLPAIASREIPATIILEKLKLQKAKIEADIKELEEGGVKIEEKNI